MESLPSTHGVAAWSSASPLTLAFASPVILPTRFYRSPTSSSTFPTAGAASHPLWSTSARRPFTLCAPLSPEDHSRHRPRNPPSRRHEQQHQQQQQDPLSRHKRPYMHRASNSLSPQQSSQSQPQPPSSPSPRRSVRVPRHQTFHHDNWQWTGAAPRPPFSNQPPRSHFHSSHPCDDEHENGIPAWTSTTWLRLRHALHRSGQTLSQTTAPFLTRITALGALVLRHVTDVISRALVRVDADASDITVEYGIADPSPLDKTFVDPLLDWDIATHDCAKHYCDSTGNPVFLQLHGASALVAATDFRDVSDDVASVASDSIQQQHPTQNQSQSQTHQQTPHSSEPNSTSDASVSL